MTASEMPDCKTERNRDGRDMQFCFCNTAPIGRCTTCGAPVCHDHSRLTGNMRYCVSVNCLGEAERLLRESWDEQRRASERARAQARLEEERRLQSVSLLLRALAGAGMPGSISATVRDDVVAPQTRPKRSFFRREPAPRGPHGPTVRAYFSGYVRGQFTTNNWNEYPEVVFIYEYERLIAEDGRILQSRPVRRAKARSIGADPSNWEEYFTEDETRAYRRQNHIVADRPFGSSQSYVTKEGLTVTNQGFRASDYQVLEAIATRYGIEVPE